jgi:sugar phosphate isomerase/epimerase
MRLGVFSKTFEGREPDGVLAQVSRAGFSATQYNMACSGLPSMPDAIDPAVSALVALAAAKHSVQIVAVSGTYNMIHPDLAVRQAGHKRLETLAVACASLGAPLITLCTGTRDAVDMWRKHAENDSSDAWRDLLTSMETAIAIADRYHILLGIEPELANVVDSASRARNLIDQLGSPRLRIVLDPANLFEVATLGEQQRIVAAAIDLLADRIVMGHAKDRLADGRFAAAGSGVLDYAHYVSTLKTAGFSGPLITHGLSAAEAAGVGYFLKRVLADAGIATTA